MSRGPAIRSSRTRVESGTISPRSERTQRRCTSSGAERRAGLREGAHPLRHAGELREAPAAPVLELELEAARAREAAHRRGIERQDARALDRREPGSHLGEDRLEGPARRFAL